MPKKNDIAMQWKVVRGLHVDRLEKQLELWTNKGWTVHSIHGPQGMMAVVLSRFLTL